MRKKPMLAYPVSAKPIDYNKPTFIQPKLDGVRCVLQCEWQDSKDEPGEVYDKVVNVEVDPMTETELNALSIKIVSRMVKLKSMEDWFDHVNSSDIAIEVMDKKLSLTQEENALGELAKYMTLMNMFEDKEEYEKCAVCKLKIDNVNKILEKY